MSKNYFENYTKEELIDALECGANNIRLLQQERDAAQDKWNELKKWLVDTFYMSYYEEELSSGWVVSIMKEKMQELEKK